MAEAVRPAPTGRHQRWHRRDLSLIARFAAYEAVFGTRYALSDPDVEDNDVEMLHESLLSADPSGREGRPGSTPQKFP
jgi:hypothetical protein